MELLKKILIYSLLVFLLVICVLPFYLVIVNSTYSAIEIVTKLKLVPGSHFMDNYLKMQELTNIWRGFLNSLLIAVPYVVLSGYFGAFAGFGFAKYRFKGSRILFAVVIGSMMLPTQLSIIGFYKLNLRLGLLNTFWPFIIPGIANASAVFFLKGMIEETVSDSLIEAARMDGLSELAIFNKVVLPCVSPGIATMCIFNFVSCWNNYLSPLIILSDSRKFTMPILISTIKGIFLANYAAMYVAIAISVIPIIIVYLFLSKYIINGLTIGAVK